MTLDEIILFLKAMGEQEKRNRTNLYLQASLVASFVGRVFNGKPIPSIETIFPEIINKPTEVDEEKAQAFYKEQMIEYAKAFNRKRKKRGENV